MPDAVQIRLPYPPSVNTYWRKFRNRMVISKRGKQYRAQVAYLIHDLKLMRYFNSGDKLRATLLVYPPDRRRRDIDNVQKAVFDALGGHVLYPDDYQIADIRIKRMTVEKHGLIYAQIKRI